MIALCAACNGNSEITIEELTETGSGEITVEYLTGTWRAIEPGSFIQYNPDGTYRIALSIDGLEVSPVEEGQYTLEGNLFTFISSDESSNCEAGDRGVYEIERIGEDEMRHTRLEDECFIRSNEPKISNLERVP